MVRFVCPDCGASQAGPGLCAAEGRELAPIGEDLLLGTVIGPYRVARLLGIGGMGRVYKGVHPSIGSRVAIKVLSRECSDRQDVVQRFFDEARAVNVINHESIVNVLDLAMLPDGRPYIIMEYLDGAPLSTLLETAVEHNAPLPLGGLARLAAEVLDALGAAHAKGIVHRDLKPDNIYVTPSGRPKVLDFGIAKLTDPGAGSSSTRTGSLLGTPQYMSPEQASGRPVDHRADIYAMGIILFECATGRKPFQAEALFDLLRAHVEAAPPSPRAFRPQLSVELEQVILTALAKAPDERFASAHAMSVALQHATAHLPATEWAPITGAPGAPGLPSAWAPTPPASWGGARSARPSVQPPLKQTTSSGQVTSTTPRGSRAGLWLALGAVLLVGGGVTAAVVAGGSATEAPTVASSEPAGPAPAGSPPPLAVAPAGSPPPAPPSPASPTPATPTSAAATPPAVVVADTDDDEAGDVLEDALDALDAAPLTAAQRKVIIRYRGMGELSAAQQVKQAAALSRELAVLAPKAAKAEADEGDAPDPAAVVKARSGAPATSPAIAAARSAGAWVERGSLSFPGYDPKRVDVTKFVAFAMAQARRAVPDAELFRIDVDGVAPDGFANLAYPSHASDRGSIDLRFRSPSRSKPDPSIPLGVKQEWKCEFRIEAEYDGVHIRPVDGWACKDPGIPAPRCSLAAVWKRAIASKAPTNAIASLGYRSAGNKPRWYFNIGSGFDKVFSEMFGDDC